MPRRPRIGIMGAGPEGPVPHSLGGGDRWRSGKLYADGVYSREEYEAARDEVKRRLEALVVPDPVGVMEAG